jgi:hypothetical protein
MKERLGTIVRSKEGSVLVILRSPLSLYISSIRKMVNVNAHLPFDLYNQQPTASSSRSASANRPHTNRNTHPSNSHKPFHHGNFVNLNQPSPSHSHSTTSLSRNNSASRSSSLYYNPTEANDVDSSTRYPILNVRLVRRSEPGGSGSQYLRKGRPRARSGMTGPTERSNLDAEPDTVTRDHRAPAVPSPEMGGVGDNDMTPRPSYIAGHVEAKGELGDAETDVVSVCYVAYERRWTNIGNHSSAPFRQPRHLYHKMAKKVPRFDHRLNFAMLGISHEAGDRN